MPPPKQMTANPTRPSRHRAGKILAQDSSSDGSEEGEEDIEEESQVPTERPTSPKPPLKSAGTLKPLGQQSNVALAPPKPQIDESEFVTESEGSENGSAGASGSESEEESEAEVSEEEEETQPQLLRPVFMSKAKRACGVQTKSAEEIQAEEDARRRQKADELVQEQIEKHAAARAAGKKNWDDDEVEDAEEIDDTDYLDAASLEAEYAKWELRELQRIKRERDVLVAAEREREEVERRRNMDPSEREREDREYIEGQKAEREGKGKMAHMQKYFHKGAFFADDSKQAGLADRDIMGGRYEDDVLDREALPEYMQIRDQTRLGKKGRTRYRDMKTEDTGRFGDYNRDRPSWQGGDRRHQDKDVDERFLPDNDRHGLAPSGANASSLGERKRPKDEDDRGGKRARVQ
ncbi:hypothetical protein P152DRAFT_464939 [Eremomyces bilateralis CBS 781.70]|uniref:Micro-fibrillar-associated protein 1 C-terminal domain-containing protein n=1 Tax=Eremomyces bilateralis CBS 781.70 TaxID=1392243 RepID=A0A6G1GB63_9PEZI|nr:uncharacterized protein P152DRAFT_464939 [Eremomyces bilateralis CBS 781.70]KAF1815089.1 hypothetical protein P152DRAFT_464939 [Eremomyces bilateralis CBS 781.70]